MTKKNCAIDYYRFSILVDQLVCKISITIDFIAYRNYRFVTPWAGLFKNSIKFNFFQVIFETHLTDAMTKYTTHKTSKSLLSLLHLDLHNKNLSISKSVVSRECELTMQNDRDLSRTSKYCFKGLE